MRPDILYAGVSVAQLGERQELVQAYYTEDNDQADVKEVGNAQGEAQ